MNLYKRMAWRQKMRNVLGAVFLSFFFFPALVWAECVCGNDTDSPEYNQEPLFAEDPLVEPGDYHTAVEEINIARNLDGECNVMVYYPENDGEIPSYQHDGTTYLKLEWIPQDGHREFLTLDEVKDRALKLCQTLPQTDFGS